MFNRRVFNKREPLSYVGVSTGNINTAVSTTKMSVHANTVTGDRLLIFVSSYNRTITTPSGATPIYENIGNSLSRRASVYIQNYSGASPQVVLSGVSDSGRWIVVTLRGGGPVTASSYGEASSGGSVAIPDVTVAYSDSTIVCFGTAYRNDSTSMTIDLLSGLTEIADNSHVRNSTSTTAAAGIRENYASGTFSGRTITASSASAMTGVYVVIRKT